MCRTGTDWLGMALLHTTEDLQNKFQGKCLHVLLYDLTEILMPWIGIQVSLQMYRNQQVDEGCTYPGDILWDSEELVEDKTLSAS